MAFLQSEAVHTDVGRGGPVGAVAGWAGCPLLPSRLGTRGVWREVLSPPGHCVVLSPGEAWPPSFVSCFSPTCRLSRWLVHSHWGKRAAQACEGAWEGPCRAASVRLQAWGWGLWAVPPVASGLPFPRPQQYLDPILPFLCQGA